MIIRINGNYFLQTMNISSSCPYLYQFFANSSSTFLVQSSDSTKSCLKLLVSSCQNRNSCKCKYRQLPNYALKYKCICSYSKQHLMLCYSSCMIITDYHRCLYCEKVIIKFDLSWLFLPCFYLKNVVCLNIRHDVHDYRSITVDSWRFLYHIKYYHHVNHFQPLFWGVVLYLDQ